jgi:hypothetical protein
VAANLTSLQESKKPDPYWSETKKSSLVTTDLLSVDRAVEVTFRKVDWSGEQVNVQKKLRKLAQQAGHAEIIGAACLVEAIKSSTWSWLQHALECSKDAPQVDTSKLRSSLLGYNTHGHENKRVNVAAQQNRRGTGEERRHTVPRCEEWRRHAYLDCFLVVWAWQLLAKGAFAATVVPHDAVAFSVDVAGERGHR